MESDLMKKNADHAGRAVDWKRTTIRVTPAAASQPYAKDAAIADAARRKRLHTALDRMLSEKNYTTDKAARMHALLDRLLDDEEEPQEESESEEEEVDDDAEPEGEGLAMDRRQVAYDAAPTGHRQFGRWAGNLSRKEYEKQERMSRMRVH